MNNLSTCVLIGCAGALLALFFWRSSPDVYHVSYVTQDGVGPAHYWSCTITQTKLSEPVNLPKDIEAAIRRDNHSVGEKVCILSISKLN